MDKAQVATVLLSHNFAYKKSDALTAFVMWFAQFCALIY